MTRLLESPRARSGSRVCFLYRERRRVAAVHGCDGACPRPGATGGRGLRLPEQAGLQRLLGE